MHAVDRVVPAAAVTSLWQIGSLCVTFLFADAGILMVSGTGILCCDSEASSSIWLLYTDSLLYLVCVCRYLSTGCEEYWQGDLEAALRPHPTLIGTQVSPAPGLVL